MKKILFTAWLTVLCFLLFGNVYAWDVPAFLRINGGARMWFTELQGDLIQGDRTKLDLAENLGIKRTKLVYEFFGSARIENIHVLRVRAEPYSVYEQSGNDSSLKVSDWWIGYDLDFYMNPQMLLGANIDAEILNIDTKVRNVTVGGNRYTYDSGDTQVIPMIGIHGTFYPIFERVALRPNVSGRVNWWNYNNLEAWDWEAASSVDIPVNNLWTWTVSSGYRFSHIKKRRSRDTLDVNRSGFFLETSILF